MPPPTMLAVVMGPGGALEPWPGGGWTHRVAVSYGSPEHRIRFELPRPPRVSVILTPPTETPRAVAFPPLVEYEWIGRAWDLVWPDGPVEPGPIAVYARRGPRPTLTGAAGGFPIRLDAPRG